MVLPNVKVLFRDKLSPDSMITKHKSPILTGSCKVGDLCLGEISDHLKLYINVGDFRYLRCRRV